MDYHADGLECDLIKHDIDNSFENVMNYKVFDWCRQIVDGINHELWRNS